MSSYSILMLFFIVRASVHVKLPKLAAGGQEQLQAVADQFQLQVCLCLSHFMSEKNFNHLLRCVALQVNIARL